MGTFGSFGTVRLGIYAAQKGLDVTGNNITNINTEGYTRQRLNQVSLIPSVCDRYASSFNVRIGQGAVIAGVNQIRDPGLDISYRKAVSNTGSANAKLEGLNDLASILDEVGKGDLEQDDGVVFSQLNDLRDLISKAIASGGSSTYDSLIRASADALAKHFNSYANDLAELKTTYENSLNQEVTEVNDILTQIRDLNVSIRNADLRGDPALELRDNRNLLLDKLSEYMKIDVKYSMEDVGANTMVEKLTVTLATGNKSTLVDGEFATQLSTEDPEAGEGKYLQRNPNYDPTKEITATNKPYLKPDGTPTSRADLAATVENTNYTLILSPLKDSDGDLQSTREHGVVLSEADVYGSLQSIRDILNGKGEYATDSASLAAGLSSGIDEVNQILKDIQDLNDKIYANPAPADVDLNILKNDRDQLLESLNGLVGIDVTTSDPDTSMVITLKDGAGVTLLNSTTKELNELSLGTGTTDQYSVFIGNQERQVSGTIKQLQDSLSVPADTTLDPDASTKRGIPYYQMALDNLAYQFATEMNKLNNTGLEGSGNLFSIGSSTDAATGIDPDTGEAIRITASNISVSNGWDNQAISIQFTADKNAPSGDTSNLSRFLGLFNQKVDFDPGDINPGAAGDSYQGSFEDMLLKIQSTLAEDQMSTDAILNNYIITADDLYVDREGVMGVDLNDEATNLMTYQKAYTAACRLLTVLEEALDSLINGTV